MHGFVQNLKSQHLILLQGPLGVGKTTFVQIMVGCLNSNSSPAKSSPVSSPTFALHNTYHTPLYKVEHLDLYRHKNLDDIESTGLWDVFERQNCLVAVEWAERLPLHMWPLNWPCLQINLSFTQDTNARCLQMHEPPQLFV